MKNIVLLLVLCTIVFHSAHSQQRARISAEFDKIVKEHFPFQKTGGVVLVSSHGSIIYKKALGMANLELGVSMKVNSVFKIGSITKQFTAVAILQLMELGKLSLQDEITRFIPNYPVQGNKITIESLLTHTSGIRDYTSLLDTVQRSKIDFTPIDMIAYFSNQPMRFATGTRYEYSNSNYFLLGYIIEMITGTTYQKYLEDHFFKPLQMRSSYYGDDAKIIEGRALGYTVVNNEIKNAASMSMTQPYAAGAILSTVEDLFIWQQALESNQLITKQSLENAFARYRLVNGKEINYGFGWRQGYIQQSPSIWHGGLINGFMTMELYLPKEDVYVVVFSNCDRNSPEKMVAKLAAMAIGKPYAYKEMSLKNSDLQDYVGVYENDNGDQYVISLEKGKLYAQTTGNQKVHVKAFQKDQFYFADPMITVEFSRDKNVVNKLTIHSRSANEIWVKSNKPMITRNEIQLDEKTLEMYTGEYEVTPEFSFVISKQNDRLYLQAKGQEKLEMFAEANNKFFLKVNDARFEFVLESAKVTKVILKQGGRTTDAMKIK